MTPRSSGGIREPPPFCKDISVTSSVARRGGTMGAEVETYVMTITITFSQIARLDSQARRWRVRICPRTKPRSMKITSATRTVVPD